MKSGLIMSTVFCAMSSELPLLCAGYHSVASVQYMSPQLFDQFCIDYFAGAVSRSAILYNEKPRVAITLMIYFVLLTFYEPYCDKHCLVNHATACMSTLLANDRICRIACRSEWQVKHLLFGCDRCFTKGCSP